MQRINLDEDVRPVSEFRQNAAKFVQQVRTTHRPLVLTQHGRSAAVLLDVGEYERMLETLGVVRDVARAEREIEAGEVIDHDKVFDQLLAEYPE
ncbi:MAG TPA: type II toxin-antitoxin system Phd/YefM family antitoxin [Longimicrobiaceae bacterium]|nr:type II toxin-antitoxin system Phd/YefM family antitoxin [Longimicrobiaceae bacterium]